MNWYIPNTDPTVMYAINELARWAADNWVTLLVATQVLTLLQVAAYKTKNVYDDKVITFLLYVISFKWLKNLRGQIGTKENPIILKDEVK